MAPTTRYSGKASPSSVGREGSEVIDRSANVSTPFSDTLLRVDGSFAESGRSRRVYHVGCAYGWGAFSLLICAVVENGDSIQQYLIYFLSMRCTGYGST